MPDDGQNFTAPTLTKKEPKPALRVWCGHCDLPVRAGVLNHDMSNGQEWLSDGSGGRWMLHEGGPGEPPMVFSAYCHGDEYHLGIEDVDGFNEVMDKYREYTTKHTPFVVFPKEVIAPLSVDGDLTDL